jgi:hypothetical protein
MPGAYGIILPSIHFTAFTVRPRTTAAAIASQVLHLDEPSTAFQLLSSSVVDWSQAFMQLSSFDPEHVVLQMPQIPLNSVFRPQPSVLPYSPS